MALRPPPAVSTPAPAPRDAAPDAAFARTGPRIKVLRRQRQMSVEELANATGVHKAHVSRLERGLDTPSIGMLARLAAALGTTMGHLAGETLDETDVKITRADDLAAVLHRIDPAPSRQAAAVLAAAGSQQRAARGQPLLRQGEVWRSAWIVQRGLVRMSFLRRDGKEFNKNFHAEGALICPITEAMWSAPSLFAVHCVEPTVLWRCDAALLRATLHAEGAWEPLQRALLAHLLTAKLQREHDLLALSGLQRYQSLCRTQPELAQRVPLQHLATYLGLTDVSLSRIRRSLREHGALP